MLKKKNLTKQIKLNVLRSFRKSRSDIAGIYQDINYFIDERIDKSSDDENEKIHDFIESFLDHFHNDMLDSIDQFIDRVKANKE